MPGTILIVDDLAVNRMLLRSMLCGDYDILEAENGARALETLADARVSVCAVLLDIQMPVMDGYATLRAIRADTRLSHLPVIMITAFQDKKTRVTSLAMGANDYVEKPYRADVIAHCLKNCLALSEASAAVRLLERDRLTGVYARDSFFDRAAALIAGQPEGAYVLVCVDIENFNIINDQYGDRQGDAVLRSLAAALNDMCVGDNGICGRISADQFVALCFRRLDDADGSALRMAEERVARQTGIQVTLSAGCCRVTDKTITVSALYDRARIARDTVKGHYDAHMAVYEESMRQHILEEQRVVNDMRRALSEKQFDVCLQPQYSLSTGALIGAELLARWHHPDRGLIPPAVFIPIFERNGFVFELDQYMFTRACALLSKWIKAGHAPLPLSVNIAGCDLLRENFIKLFVGIARGYDVPPSLLRLEIKEAVFSGNTERMIAAVAEMNQIGFDVVIDNFGSGGSSLSTLRDVPARIIKLDMAFLAADDRIRRGGSIVESTLRMAKWLGMTVIAEGVETTKQADFLKSIGCDYAQGYLYAPPMPVCDYEALAARASREDALAELETAENLNHNAFWDPETMDSLIFNSYVGTACIFEYWNSTVELLRISAKFSRRIASCGMSACEALAMKWHECISRADIKRLDGALQQSVQTHDDVVLDIALSGVPHCPPKLYLRLDLRVVAASSGRYLVYCTHEDRTGQREAECRREAAEKKERDTAVRMRAVVENVNSGIAAFTENGSQTVWLFTNERFHQILGCTRARLISDARGPLYGVHPDDRAHAAAVIRRAGKVGVSAEGEYRVLLESGGTACVRATFSCHRFDGVSTPVLVMIITDITAEKKAEHDIMVASAQMFTMMNDMPGGCMRLHFAPHGAAQLVFMNDGMTALTGMSRDTLIGMHARDMFSIVHPDDVDLVRDFIAEMRADGNAHSARYRLRHQCGGYVYLSVIGRKTEDASGEAFYNLYYMDLSQQIRQEETQRELLDHLPGGAGLFATRNGCTSVIYLNKSYWQLVGRHATVCMDDVRAVLHPDDAAKLSREFHAAVSDGRDMACDIRIMHETRGYIAVRLLARVVPAEHDGYFVYASFTPMTSEAV